MREDIARVIYEAHCKTSGISGQWDTLAEPRRKAWLEAADAAVGFLMPQLDSEQVFFALLVAAMRDAIDEGTITQLQTQLFSPRLKKTGKIRILTVPEEMALTFPSPLGKKETT